MTYKNEVHDKIMRKTNSGNSCYFLAQTLSSFYFLSKTLYFMVHESGIVLTDCETWPLAFKDEYKFGDFE